MIDWHRIEDGLPEPIEKFKNGTWYHGYFNLFFPEYAEGHQIRKSTLFTYRGKNPRWSAVNYTGKGMREILPTHWMPLPSIPKGKKTALTQADPE